MRFLRAPKPTTYAKVGVGSDKGWSRQKERAESLWRPRPTSHVAPFYFGVVGVVVDLLSLELVLAGSPVFIGGTALSIASAGGCAPSVPPGAFISGVAESIVLVGASSPGFVGAGAAVCANALAEANIKPAMQSPTFIRLSSRKSFF